MNHTNKHTKLFIVGIVSLIFCVAIACFAVAGKLSGFDGVTKQLAELSQSSALTSIAVFVTTLLSPGVILLGAIVIAALFVDHKRYYDALVLVVGVGGGMLAGAAVKALTAIPRPEHGLLEASGYSFPSGHALAATIFFILLLYIFWNTDRSLSRKSFYVAVTVVIILVASISRVYLGVHWMSDVVGGMLLGFAWSACSIAIADASARHWQR